MTLIVFELGCNVIQMNKNYVQRNQLSLCQILHVLSCFSTTKTYLVHFPLCKAFRTFLSGIRLTQARLGVPTREDPINFVVGITLNPIALIIQPWQNLAHEARLLLLRSRGLELRKPDWTSASHRLRLSDMTLKIRNTLIIGKPIPMYSNEIDLAARALADEIGQPVQACGTTSVADGWGADLNLASKLLHVRPRINSFLRRHIGLSSEVWFVEAENVGRAVGDGRLDV